MRSRIVTSGMMAVAAVAVLSLSVPAFAVEEEPVSTSGSLETVEQTDDEEATTGTLDEVADEVDDSVTTVEDEVDGAASAGPGPVADTVDSTTDTASDTTDAATDTVQQGAGEPTAPGGSGTKDQRGAGDDPAPAPAPGGRALAGGGAPAPAPARVALDGFRRTSGGSAAHLVVTEDPVFEQEPTFAPPTTREVAGPTTAVPPLPLRTVAIEILVAAALLVMATGGLVAEMGPERV